MPGYVIFIIVLILPLSARRPARGVMAWGVGLAIALGFVTACGFFPMSAISAGGFGAAIGGSQAFAPGPRRGKPRKLPFDATYSHDNLAINTTLRQVWVRDVSGDEYVLTAAEIRQLSHRWVERAAHKLVNRIELQTGRLDRPVLTALFDRHPGTVKGVGQNAREAEEWQARLNAFING